MANSQMYQKTPDVKYCELCTNKFYHGNYSHRLCGSCDEKVDLELDRIRTIQYINNNKDYYGL